MRSRKKGTITPSVIVLIATLLQALPSGAAYRLPQAAQDLQTERSVRYNLAMNSNLIGDQIDARAKNGIVVLRGKVRTLQEKRLAEEIAASSGPPGTIVVLSKIQIEGSKKG